MKRPLFRAAIALALLTLASSASAVTGEAYASITNLRFSVTDLDPADGVAASYHFAFNEGDFVESYYPSGTVADVQAPWAHDFAPFSALSQSVVGSDHLFSAEVQSDSLRATARDSRVGAGGGSWTSVMATSNNGTLEMPQLSRLLLVVSPMTELVVTGDIEVSASTGCSAFDQSVGNCRTTAFAFFQFSGAYAVSDHRMVEYWSNGNGATLTAVNDSASTLSGAVVSAANWNRESVALSFQAIAYADTWIHQLSPVPEPSSAILALLGFGVVAGSVHRSRRAR